MKDNIGIKINKLRTEKGMTLEDLALKIGTDKSYIWSIENGRIKNPSLDTMSKLADILDTTTDYLLNEVNGIPEKATIIERNTLYRNYSKLEQKDKETIKNMIDFLKKNAKKKDDEV